MWSKAKPIKKKISCNPIIRRQHSAVYFYTFSSNFVNFCRYFGVFSHFATLYYRRNFSICMEKNGKDGSHEKMLALSNAAAGAVAGLLGGYGLWGVVCRGLLCGHVPTQHAPGCHCPAHAVQCVFYSRIKFYHTVLYVSVPDFGLHFFF